MPLSTKQVLLDATYAGPVAGTPAVGDSMTTVVAKLAGNTPSAAAVDGGAPSTVTTAPYFKVDFGAVT